jgi:N-acetylglucosaminyldiphosphoundecaprenol N-acetyl-beta-D-mannosaminyltransferase
MEAKTVEVGGLRLSCLSLDEMAGQMVTNVMHGRGSRVYCCTMNELMMAVKDKKWGKKLKDGDTLTADGMPLVWVMRMKGCKSGRVYGPDLMRKFQVLNKRFGIKQTFVGDDKNRSYFLKIGEYVILPFKDDFDDNDYKMVVSKVVISGSRVVWLGLGGRKQVVVAHELAKRLPDRIYVTVGAAFDFVSGRKKQAPVWLRKCGGEWLYRLISEPERLWKRYLGIWFFLFKQAVNRFFKFRGSRE